MKADYRKRYTQDDVKNPVIDSLLIRRLLSYLRPYQGWAIFAIAILFISRAIEAWVPIQLGQLAQGILNHLSVSSEQQQAFFNTVVKASGIMILWIVLSYLFDMINIYLKNWISQEALLALRAQLYDHIQRLPVRFYDHYAVGRLMTRAIHDVEQINQLFAESVIPIMGSLFLFICMFIGLLFVNWQVGLLMLIIAPALWWFTQRFRYYQRLGYQSIRAIVSAMNAFVQEHLMGLGIVKSFNLSREEKEKFDELNEDHFTANVDTVHHFALFFSGIEWIQSVTMILVFVLLVQLAPSEGGFQAGTYFTISLYGLMIFRPLFDLAERYNLLQSALAAAERIFEILDTPLEPAGPQPGRLLLQVESIVFDHVWFAYKGEHWILKDISFTIQERESVALVGMTGSGKTSIINLLLRFYEFQRGSIRINGYDIREYSVESLRNQFSVILQDPVIFSGTIEENISLYDSNITQEDIKHSTQQVHLYPWIETLPGQFQFYLHERGIGLSVGEMQLLSLARAVAHHRSVLIFDEATANIDLQTEKTIQQALSDLLKQKTALVIAHRLSTIRNVQRILVLSEGKLVEEGSHDDLMTFQGLYEKLYRLQFASV